MLKPQTKHIGYTSNTIENLDDGHSKVLEMFKKISCKKILDVGSGDGNFSCLLKEVSGASEVYGVDHSKGAVNMACALGVKCCLADVEVHLPFEDNFFDAVFAGYVVEHLFDVDTFFKEVNRVLKPDGTFVLSTPNLASFYNRVSLSFGFQPFGSSVSLKHNIGHLVQLDNMVSCADHIRLFTAKSLVEMLKHYGFDVRKKVGVRIPAGYYHNMSEKIKTKKAKIINTLDKAVSHFPSISYAILIECMKQQKIA